MDGLFSNRRLLVQVLLRFAGAATVVLFILMLGLYGIYEREKRYELLLIEEQSQQVLENKVKVLAREFRWVRSDLLFLAGQDGLRGIDSATEEQIQRLKEEYIRLARRKKVYDQIRFLNAEGRELVRINYAAGDASAVSEDELQTKANRYYYQAALQLPRGEVFISPLDLNVEHGQIERPLKPVVRFITPVDDDDGRRLGLVAINYRGGDLLNRLAMMPAGVRGSLLVLNNDGQYLRGRSAEDAWGWLLGHGRSFAKEFTQEWNQLTVSGEMQVVSEKGLFTFRRFAPGSHTGDHQEVDGNLVLVDYVSRRDLFVETKSLMATLLVASTGGAVAVLLLAGYWAYAGAVKKHQRERLMASEARLRVLSRELLASQENERRRISREIHDNLKQQVTALRLNLAMLGQDFSTDAPPQLARARETVDNLLDELQRLATRLRSSLLDDMGLEPAIEELLRQQSELGIVDYELDMEPDLSLPTDTIENIFRIVQEATNNIEKHSEATRAHVSISNTESGTILVIRDNGKGFDSQIDQRDRLGLLGMQERAELLGGSFEIFSSRSEGTTILIQLPLPSVSS